METVMNQLPNELWQHIQGDRKIRMATAAQSHEWFFSLYLAEYLAYTTAPFQQEIFNLTERTDINHVVIVAFRGSGKSTMVTLSYPIWAILGVQQKKFVLILSQTQNQARMHLANIKREFENNELLRADFGPLEEESDEWGSSSLVLIQYGARLSAASTDQSIRGIRHGKHRPDLIICDDVEDLMSVKTYEGRNKTHNWLTGEVIPAGDNNTKLVMVGNLLHEDSLLMRVKARFDAGDMDGVFKAYPVVSDEGQILWPGKYPDLNAVEAARRKLGNDRAWLREFMLKIVPEEDQVILQEWIRYYDELPPKDSPSLRYKAIGIDLAISLRNTADFTAMLSAEVHGLGEKMKVYILPNPVNAHLSHLKTLEKAHELVDKLGNKSNVKLFVEEVGYQGSVIEQLTKDNYKAEGVKVRGQDKHARLLSVSHLVESGKVVFPRYGSHQLLQQLIGFGGERYDDLADAFSILLEKVLEHDHKPSVGTVTIGQGFWGAYWRNWENGRDRQIPPGW
jgi:predicted phage terminase large subunit-like protein